MKTNILSMLVAFFIVTSVFSQTSLNEYKYIIVPKQFSFLKSPDEHRMNSLAKFLFEKQGFTAFMEGEEYPTDFYDNRCAALKADVSKESGMFKTKLKMILKDCNDQVVYTSGIGESREKEFGKAYNEAVRNTFKSLEALNYKYTPKKGQIVVAKQSKPEVKNEVAANEIQKLKEEIQTLKKQKEAKAAKAIASKPEIVAPVKKEFVKVKEVAVKTVVVTTAKSGVLYAQETENGYQLVDSSPKVIYKIKNTSLNKVFLVEGKNAIIYKKGDNWITEYYVGNTLKQETLNIKF
ncbi:MAG: hypothetical protein ABJL44_08510 [Algibacter sp.]